MFDIDTCVCFITNKVSKKMADEFNERLVKLGTTRVQWIAMYYMLKHGKIRQKDLAEIMNIKDSTVARLIDRMEKEEQVKRIKDDVDKRVTYIELTPKGKKRIEELLPEGEKMSKIFSRNITDDEFNVFLSVLSKMEDNI